MVDIDKEVVIRFLDGLISPSQRTKLEAVNFLVSIRDHLIGWIEALEEDEDLDLDA